MKTNFLCRAGIICFIYLVAIGSNAIAFDLSSPRAAVHSFVSSINQDNFAQAAKCVEGAETEMSEAAKAIGNDWKKQDITLVLSDLRSSVDKSDATVTVNVTILTKGKKKVLSAHESHLRLSRQAEDWKIVSDDSYLYSEFEVLSFMAGVLKSSEESQKIYETAKGNAQLNSCRSNLKQISLALQMFVQDHNHIFALTSSSLKKELKAYVMDNAIYYCPVVSGDNKKELSYSFNNNLANIAEASLKDPTKTIMLYEGTNGKLNFRHNGKANVAFADGHVKAVDAEEAKSLLWTP